MAQLNKAWVVATHATIRPVKAKGSGTDAVPNGLAIERTDHKSASLKRYVRATEADKATTIASAIRLNLDEARYALKQAASALTDDERKLETPARLARIMAILTEWVANGTPFRIADEPPPAAAKSTKDDGKLWEALLSGL